MTALHFMYNYNANLCLFFEEINSEYSVVTKHFMSQGHGPTDTKYPHADDLKSTGMRLEFPFK